MATNAHLVVDKLAKRTMPLFRGQMLVGDMVSRDYVDEMTDPNSGGGKSGGTIRIKRPQRYTVRSGSTYAGQALGNPYINVPAPTMKGVDFDIPDTELSKDIEYLAEEYMVPAVAQLATQIDLDICANYTKVCNAVGKPGTAPNASEIAYAAMQRMDELNIPNDGNRNLIFSPSAKASMAATYDGFFSKELTEDAVRRGETGRIATFRTGMSNFIPNHTSGTFTAGSTAVVNGAVADDAKTIVTDAWAFSTLVLTAGDVFTIAGVYDVNPMSRESTGVLKQFVSQADVTSDGAGNATITVVQSDESDGLHFSGAYKNMSAQIADGAVLNVWREASTGSFVDDTSLQSAGAEASLFRQSLAFHRNALWLGMFPLTSDTPGSDSSTQTDPNSGLSFRLAKGWDFDNAKTKWRLDVHYSTDVLDPNGIVRVVG